jgi:hypothetical protein
VTGQQIADQVMCWSCQEPTPAADLALDAQGILTDLCRWCAEEADDPDDAGGDCEPAWAPPRSTTDLPDIDHYQEQQ